MTSRMFKRQGKDISNQAENFFYQTLFVCFVIVFNTQVTLFIKTLTSKQCQWKQDRKYGKKSCNQFIPLTWEQWNLEYIFKIFAFLSQMIGCYHLIKFTWTMAMGKSLSFRNSLSKLKDKFWILKRIICMQYLTCYAHYPTINRRFAPHCLSLLRLTL